MFQSPERSPETRTLAVQVLVERAGSRVSYDRAVDLLPGHATERHRALQERGDECGRVVWRRCRDERNDLRALASRSQVAGDGDVAYKLFGDLLRVRATQCRGVDRFRTGIGVPRDP